MAKLTSGRTKKLPQSGITSDRYQFLGLEQAEPDLGDPLVGPSSIGAKPYPQSGNAYVLISFDNQSASEGNRYWVLSSGIPGLGLVPGAVTIRDEGNLVGAANSFTTLNFVGDGIGVDYVGPTIQQQTGIATIRVSPVAYGSTGEFQFKNSSGLLSGVSDFKYDTGTTNVGFGTTLATEKLHISGNIRADRVLARTDLAGSYTLPSGENVNNYSIFGRIRSGYANFGSVGINTDLSVSGVIYASNGRGNTGEVLTSQGSSPAIWAPAVNVTVGSANSVFIQNTFTDYNYNLIFSEQNNNDIGAVRADVNQLVYNPVSNKLGIGNSLPQSALHVEGDARFSGVVTSTGFYPFTDNSGDVGSAALTWSNGYFTNMTIDSTLNVRAAIDLADNDILRFGAADDWKLYHDGADNIIDLVVGDLIIRDNGTANSPIIFELQRVSGNLGIGSSVPTSKLDVNGSVKVSGITTINNFFNVNIDTIPLVSTYYDYSRVPSGQISVGIGTTNAIVSGISTEEKIVVFLNNSVFACGTTTSYSGIGVDSGRAIDVGKGSGSLNLQKYIDFGGAATGSAYQDYQARILRDTTDNGGFDILNRGTGTVRISAGSTSAETGNIDLFAANTRIARVNTSGVLIGSIVATGTTSQQLQVTSGAYVSGNIGIGTTNPTAKLHLIGDSKFNGTVNLEKSVTEQVSRTTGFSSQFSVSSGTLTIDVSSATVAVGILTTSVTSWEFTGVSTENSKATTITLIADSSSLITYGELCKVNGQTVSGGVRWPGGVAPIPTDNEDIISFAIVRDNSGSIRVYGSISLNFS